MAWLPGWAKRVKLTIDNTDIDSALSNFPVLVYLSPSSGRNNDDVSFIFDELASDGNRKKIAITSSDGTTELYVEIEKWDDANEKAWLWVKVSSVASGSDTVLYLYYDSSHADNTTYIGDTNSTPAETVWDSSFKLVCHMRDDPDNEHVRDSTSGNHDGTKGAAGAPTVTTSGKIADAQDFVAAANELITMPDSDDWYFDGDFTIEFWVDWDSIASDVSVMGSNEGGGNIAKWTIILGYPTNDKLGFVFNQPVVGEKPVTFAWIPTINTFYRVTIKRVSNSWYMFIGSTQTGGTQTEAQAIANPAAVLSIGTDGESYQWFDGLLDEIRISKGVGRADAWIKASYESEIDDLLDFGVEETKLHSFGFIIG